MASTYTINVSNCGLQPAAWFTAAAFNNSVLSKFSPLAGVKNTITLPKMTASVS